MPRTLGATFSLYVSIQLSLLAAANAPTPLWAEYQAKWDISAITVTVVFGVYAVALLAALLTLGSLSDHIGRKPVILAGLGLEAAAMLLFATAGGLTALVVARAIQGLATGTAIGALGAGLIELDKKRGTVANGIAGLGGLALGAVSSSILVEYAPSPTRVVFLLLFAVFLIQGLAVSFTAETASPRAGALSSLRPNVEVPRSARPPFLLAVPILIATWGLSGLYASLGPVLVALVVGSRSVVVGSLGVAVYSGVAAGAVVFVRNLAPGDVMRRGSLAVLVGAALTLLGIAERSSVVFFLGTAIAGAGLGASFQGVLRTVLPCADANERAGLLSAIYVVSYVGLSVPVVIAGVVVDQGATLIHTSEGFASTVIALSLFALAAIVRRTEPARQMQPLTSPDDVMARAGCLEP